jgi:DNA-binding MarR family transcriptional regulator
MEDHIDLIRAQWFEAAPTIDTAGLEVIGRIERLSTEFDQLLAAPFRAAGIGDGDFNVLAALRRLGGAVRPSELADATIATSGAITKRLDRLHAKGLVDRLPDPDDGRSLRARLTQSGEELTDSLMLAHMTNEAKLLGGLEPVEVKELATLLRRLALTIEDA